MKSGDSSNYFDLFINLYFSVFKEKTIVEITGIEMGRLETPKIIPKIRTSISIDSNTSRASKRPGIRVTN